MKKILIHLGLALLAVTALTACGNDDEPDNKQTVSATVNTRVIDGNSVVFSQGNAKVELDYTHMLIQFTSSYKDENGTSRTITTSQMPMNNTGGGSVYSFNNNATAGSAGFENFNGSIDLATGMMWYTFNTEGATVVTTTQLLYAYTTTTITNPDNGKTGNHDMSAYLFALDTRGETCVMKVSNFVSSLNSSGTVDVPELQYDNLTVTPTPTGYVITADEVESSYKGFYTLTDVTFKLDDQCRVIDGSFKCSDLEFKVTGNVFPKAN